MNSDFKCKGEKIKKCLEQVRRQVGELQAKFIKVLGEENEKANRLAKAAFAEHVLIPSKVLSFIQLSPLIDDVNVQETNSEATGLHR